MLCSASSSCPDDRCASATGLVGPGMEERFGTQGFPKHQNSFLNRDDDEDQGQVRWRPIRARNQAHVPMLLRGPRRSSNGIGSQTPSVLVLSNSFCWGCQYNAPNSHGAAGRLRHVASPPDRLPSWNLGRSGSITGYASFIGTRA
jgi:hypothetical protein